MKRKANAIWQGNGKEGAGKLTTTSGVLNNTPYSFTSRFVNEDGKSGTNPEELIAAAHAGCFNMALSFQLGGAGFTPNQLDTQATITMENLDGHFKITGILLSLSADIPEITDEKFQELALNAKQNCPISTALAAVPIELDARLL